MSEGRDPAIERKRAGSAETLTLEAAARARDEALAALGKVDDRTRRDALARLTRRVFPALGARPLARVTREDLTSVLDVLVKKT